MTKEKRKPQKRWLLPVLFLVLTAAGTALSPPRQPASWTIQTMEAFLQKAAVVRIERDVELGRTLPWRVTLRQGRTEGRAFFKYGHRSSPPPLRNSYKYELAAYALNRFLNLEIVPPVVERTIDKTPGALQWYLENCRSERDRERIKLEPPDLDAFLRRLDIVQVFEALVHDECGDKDDTLIHKDTWKICRVDFSEAFPAVETLPPGGLIQRCSRDLYDRLKRMKRNDLADLLRPYLETGELGALLARKDKILELLDARIREKGEKAVLFADPNGR